MFNELCFAAQIGFISIGSILFAMVGKEALTAYVSLLFVMANIFVIKQIMLFGLTVTSADCFIIGIGFSLNLLQEFWGKEFATKTVLISFGMSLVYLIIASSIVAYVPSNIDQAQEHLAFINAHTTRIVVASFIAYLATQYLDIQIYGHLKKISQGKYFALRNYFSLCFSQLIDTILFSFLGLWGIVANIGHIMIVSYIIKLIAVFCMSPFLIFAKQFIQRHQKKF